MKKAVLFDLPTFPRGVLPLSLPTVAACLRPRLHVRLVDLNLHEAADYRRVIAGCRPFHLGGLKVSAQNLDIAHELTAMIREIEPGAAVVWGGELPTLLPEACRDSADSVVRGRFEPVAGRFLDDFERGALARSYEDSSERPCESPIPALDLVERPEAYLRFMGAPLESSCGCRRGCRFCLASVMQKTVVFRPAPDIVRDLDSNPREFVNVVDYNLGNDRAHLLSLADIIGRSPASGWMAEFCLEDLDDEQVLEALSRSRCRAAYCGLESLSAGALAAVGKSHNAVGDYLRIIRKAQGHGLEVGAGFIIGMEGTTRETFPAFREFGEEAGLLYLKLTTLTFSPGTASHADMARRGRYLTDDLRFFDGVRLTYLPSGVSAEVLREGTRHLIESFYSLPCAWRRSRHLASRPARRAEFLLFSRCFGQAYRRWLEAGALDRPDGGIAGFLRQPMRKGLGERLCEEALARLRRQAARGTGGHG